MKCHFYIWLDSIIIPDSSQQTHHSLLLKVPNQFYRWTHCILVIPYGDIDLAQHRLVMACCLTTSSHYLNHCWLITNEFKCMFAIIVLSISNIMLHSTLLCNKPLPERVLIKFSLTNGVTRPQWVNYVGYSPKVCDEYMFLCNLSSQISEISFVTNIPDPESLRKRRPYFWASTYEKYATQKWLYIMAAW